MQKRKKGKGSKNGKRGKGKGSKKRKNKRVKGKGSKKGKNKRVKGKGSKNGKNKRGKGKGSKNKRGKGKGSKNGKNKRGKGKGSKNGKNKRGKGGKPVDQRTLEKDENESVENKNTARKKEEKFSHCQYLDLTEIGLRNDSACESGGKFLFKAQKGHRRQFLMTNSSNIA